MWKSFRAIEVEKMDADVGKGRAAKTPSWTCVRTFYNTFQSFLTILTLHIRVYCFSLVQKLRCRAFSERQTSHLELRNAACSGPGTRSSSLTFFDHLQLLPERQTVNQHFYKEVFARLIARTRGARQDLRENKNWIVLHNNALTHDAHRLSAAASWSTNTLKYIPSMLGVSCGSRLFSEFVKF